MNIPDVATRATEQAPRVAVMDWNNPQHYAFVYWKPVVHERVVVECEGMTAWGTVTRYEYRPETREHPLGRWTNDRWIIWCAMDWDTLRQPDAPPVIGAVVMTRTSSPQRSKPQSRPAPTSSEAPR